MLTSVPISPPQPNKPQYGFNELYLFQNFTRVSYLGSSAEPPPPYDPSRKTKTWFDSTQSGKTGDVTYNVILNGQTEVSQITMTCAEAASLNLEGSSYPPFTPPSTYTPAVEQGMPGTAPTPIPTALICEYADALAVSKELGTDPPTNDEAVQWPNPVDWRGETRRPWAIVYKGTKYLCAGLVTQRNEKGVGRPGSWSLGGLGLTWTATPEPNWGNLPAQPTPVRALLPNERLAFGLFSGTVVQRTDMQLAVPSSQPTAGSGPAPALTAQQAAQLEFVFDSIKVILDWVQKQA